MDPVFVKAYKLLFSNEPDSADQLRGMLDHALKQRYGNSKCLSTVLSTTPPLAMEIATATATTDIDVVSKPAMQNPTDSGSDDSVESTVSPDNDKDEDLALDLLQEGLKCVICNQINVGPKNLLVECLECHLLYHQECHQPPITDADTNDPRLAWYCATCKKKMDKTLAIIKSTRAVSSTSKSTVSTSSRGSIKKSSSNSSLATSNSNSTDSTVSKSSTRSGKIGAGKTVTPVFTIITADQRLQQMKKKAAAGKKGQDKGKLTK